MFYPEELVEEIRSRNDIVEVISGYVKLQKRGNSYVGLCPFHNEKTPSFYVQPGNQMYHCFGCGVGGTVYTFVMEYENYSFPEAVRLLAERAGISLPTEDISQEGKQKATKKMTLLEINKEAARFFYGGMRMPQGEFAYEYFKKRGLSDDTIKRFGLGYAPKGGKELYQFLKSKHYSDDMLMESGLFSTSEKSGAYCKFWNRAMFPIMDANSRVIGFGGRVMGEGEPKYLNSPETLVFDKSRNLYALNIARKSRKPYFILCEGYMDVISLHQAGFTSAVASLGTAFTSGQASLIRRYVNQVYLTYDTDDAGTKAAIRALPILREAGISAKIIRMDPYKDPDELLEREGVEGFLSRIKVARNGFMFGLEVLEKNHDMQSPEGKTAFLHEAASRLTRFDEEIERNNYIEAVAKAYHVGFEELKKLVIKTAIKEGQASPMSRPKNREGMGNKKEEPGKLSQKALLTYLVEDAGIFESIKGYISPDDFTTKLYQQVAKLLFLQYEKEGVNPAKIIDHFTDEEEHIEVAGMFHTKLIKLHTKEEQDKAILDTLIRVKSNAIDYKVKHLDPTDMVGLQKIMEEKRSIDDISKIQIKRNHIE